MTEYEWMKIFGKNLAEIMQEKGYTQLDLANATGLSQTAIHQYIHAKRMPTITAITNMLYELNEDWYDFVDFGDRIER